jgi:hypothetical protein
MRTRLGPRTHLADCGVTWSIDLGSVPPPTPACVKSQWKKETGGAGNKPVRRRRHDTPLHCKLGPCVYDAALLSPSYFLGSFQARKAPVGQSPKAKRHRGPQYERARAL